MTRLVSLAGICVLALTGCSGLHGSALDQTPTASDSPTASTTVGHTWFQHVADSQLGDLMADCKIPSGDVPNPPVTQAAAEATATAGAKSEYGPAAGTNLVETRLCFRYGIPYWAVLFMPPGGFDVSGQHQPVHQGSDVQEVNAQTGEVTSGFTLVAGSG